MGESSKPNTRRGKRIVPGGGVEILQTRFGVTSIFQRGAPVREGEAEKGQDKGCVEAFIEQASFDGFIVLSRVQIPADTHLWAKLSSERKAGET